MKEKYYTLKNTVNDYYRYDPYGYPFQTFEFEFRFASKEEYLSFREDWKSEYAILSQLIRKTRNAFRKRHRIEDEMNRWLTTHQSVEKYCHEHRLSSPMLRQEALQWPLKQHARYMMALLEAAKKHVHQLRKEEKEEKATL